jgi:hypothetical protein
MSLNDIFSSDYEFTFFTDDVLDITKFNTIYDQCTLEDPSGTRRTLIYNKCLEILQVLIITPGIHVFSSFVQVDNKKYKITVRNTVWTGEGLF